MLAYLYFVTPGTVSAIIVTAMFAVARLTRLVSREALWRFVYLSAAPVALLVWLPPWSWQDYNPYSYWVIFRLYATGAVLLAALVFVPIFLWTRLRRRNYPPPPKHREEQAPKRHDPRYDI